MNLELDWEALVAVILLVLVLGLIAVVWLTRDPRSRRIRFGVFLEREHREKESDDES